MTRSFANGFYPAYRASHGISLHVMGRVLFRVGVALNRYCGRRRSFVAGGYKNLRQCSNDTG